MLEKLEKTELIELIHKLEKENNELKEKVYGVNKKIMFQKKILKIIYQMKKK